ncbi:nuclear transport factor 2 family protein [Thermoflavimicrobium dichotomicum]|uniref:Ketosteroid isomerase-related protein n=1 Tax=Thermoflavimicrobium dichotomicum TaxID=46223 RepID=A0A1I3TRK2_9BACL|nr:nuclear transport factor 2 family protein [Thermoflavimicrobium dichotomicum]SFJ72989.1 Ketosteroid isomerase-related protein [Thermoflavimicrobium dichotomicum]
MFNMIIKSMVQKTFDALNHGNVGPLLKMCASDVKHTFPGDHALGGTRKSVKGLEDWFKRIFKLLPNLRYEVKNIDIDGSLSDCKITISWADEATTSDGKSYANEGTYIIHVKNIKIVEIKTIVRDVRKIDEVCEHLAQLGVEEASAAPIEY